MTSALTVLDVSFAICCPRPAFQNWRCSTFLAAARDHKNFHVRSPELQTSVFDELRGHFFGRPVKNSVFFVFGT